MLKSPEQPPADFGSSAGRVGIYAWILVSVLGAAAAFGVGVGAFLLYVNKAFGSHIEMVFTRKPLLLATPPAPHPDAQEVEFAVADGAMLCGSLLRHGAAARRGLIVFCHEFSGDRWLCLSYLEPLRAEGFDVLAFDFRGHGKSAPSPVRERLQWVTAEDVADVGAALAWAFAQPEFAGGPIALFGVSKGGGSALAAAAAEPRVAAVAVDGAYPTHGTVVEYMAKWVSIFSQRKFVYERLPRWFYSGLCWLALRDRQRVWGVRYPKLEDAVRTYAGPLLMVHGRRDNYIPRELAARFFGQAKSKRKEFWLVDGAKHNRCAEVAGAEYHRRLAAFFGAACPPGAADAPRRAAVA
jgi:uncharacterized protein